MTAALPEQLAKIEGLIRTAMPEDVPDIIGGLERLKAAAYTKLQVVYATRGVPTPQVEQERLLNAAETASVLGVPKGQVREMMRSGRLPVVRVGKKYVRVRLSSLIEWLGHQEMKVIDPTTYSLYSRSKLEGTGDGRAAAAHQNGIGSDTGGNGRAAGRHGKHRGPLGAGRSGHQRASSQTGSADREAASEPAVEE